MDPLSVIQAATSGIATGIVETVGGLFARRLSHHEREQVAEQATMGNLVCQIKGKGKANIAITQTINETAAPPSYKSGEKAKK